jgi:hypothetical protein
VPVESAADRAVFVSADDFGVVASYTRAGGGAVDVPGIFDDPTLMVSLGERAMSQDSRPTLLCRQADLPVGAAEGSVDTVAITHPVSGVALTFRVATIEPDGQGMALLALAAAS